MKQCNVYGKGFKLNFLFSESDYLETLCEELNKNNVAMEDVNRLYIKEIEHHG